MVIIRNSVVVDKLHGYTEFSKLVSNKKTSRISTQCILHFLHFRFLNNGLEILRSKSKDTGLLLILLLTHPLPSSSLLLCLGFGRKARSISS